jgi:hypothetical protein
LVLINDLPLLEAECGIRVHGGGLDEWLELIPGVSGCALDPDEEWGRQDPPCWQGSLEFVERT